MAQSKTIDSLQDTFTFMFRDPDWGKKFVIGSLLALAGMAVPILPYIVLWGYAAQIARRIVSGDAPAASAATSASVSAALQIATSAMAPDMC